METKEEQSSDTTGATTPTSTPLEDAQPAASAVALPPPNGGLNAWIQVLGAHFLFFNSW